MAEFLKYAIRENYWKMREESGEELQKLRRNTARMWRKMRQERRVNFGGKA